jgi:hypothetical protein
VRRITEILCLLLLTLLTNSCAFRKKQERAIPTLSGRTQLEIQLSQIAWDHARCYLDEAPPSFGEKLNLDKVEQKISACKQLLLDKLNMKEATALRDYFKAFYPTAGDALAGIRRNDGCCVSSPVTPKKISYPKQESGVPETQTSQIVQMFDWLVAWAAKRLTYQPDSRRFLVNLAVNTFDEHGAKGDAQLKLYYLDGSAVQSIRTQSSFQQIYRGLYRYTVDHSDYKPFDSGKSIDDPHLNLVDWDWNDKGLSCKLVPWKSDQMPLPCNLSQ